MHSDVPSAPQERDPYAEPAGVPPAEAIRATRVAARVAHELHDAGRDVRFSLAGPAARVEIMLCDVDGMVLSHMSPGRALEIAAGSPVRPAGR